MAIENAGGLGTLLVVGFDSAWTPGGTGAICAARLDRGRWVVVDKPEPVDFQCAATRMRRWIRTEAPTATVVMLDQPLVVAKNGMRPVERIVATPVCRAKGGVQPGSPGGRRAKMHGCQAPVWKFLEEFSGSRSPSSPESELTPGHVHVFEVFPSLSILGMNWRVEGRLPKYKRKKDLDQRTIQGELNDELEFWDIDAGISEPPPNPKDLKVWHDAIDAWICLVTGLRWLGGKETLIVGDGGSGYMVSPAEGTLEEELLGAKYFKVHPGEVATLGPRRLSPPRNVRVETEA